MPTLERSFDVAASPETVFQVISDFERYPEFLPEIREARFDRQDNESALAHFDLFILLHVRYSLSLKLLSPNKISWELTDSNVLEANRGAWEIERTDIGSHVRYQVEISLKGSVLRGSSIGSVAIIWMRCSRVFRKEFSLFDQKMMQRSLRLHEYALTMLVGGGRTRCLMVLLSKSFGVGSGKSASEKVADPA